jgi:hypothetical protein
MKPDKSKDDAIKRWIVDHFVHSNPLNTLIYYLDDIFDSIQWDKTGNGKFKCVIDVTVNGVQLWAGDEIIVDGPMDDDERWNYSGIQGGTDVLYWENRSFRKRATIAIRDYFIKADIFSGFELNYGSILAADKFSEKVARVHDCKDCDLSPPSHEIHLVLDVNGVVKSDINGFYPGQIGNCHDT